MTLLMTNGNVLHLLKNFTDNIHGCMLSRYTGVCLYMESVSTQKKTSLGREDWLKAAMSVLFELGIDSISIVQMAESLNVTRGSFYHHFTDREDLLDAILEYWEQIWTVNIRESISLQNLAPVDALIALVTTIRSNKAAEFDAPFRAWALHDPHSRKVLERIDEFRLDYIRSLFEAGGFEGIDAENRARLLLYYEISDPAFFARQHPESESALIDERLKLLLQKND